MANDAKKLKELYVILQYLAEDQITKIPKDLLNSIEENMDKTHEFSFDVFKPLDKQGISKETLALLAYINTEFLLNSEQKELMKKVYKTNM